MFFYKRQVPKKKKKKKKFTASEADRYNRHEIYEILLLKQGTTKLQGGFKVDH